MGSNEISDNRPRLLVIEDLRVICNRIFDHIQNDLELRDLKLEDDYYWEIDDSLLFKVATRPEIVEIGSLLDDYEFVRSSVTSDSEVPSLMLIHVSPLLRYLGNRIGQ